MNQVVVIGASAGGIDALRVLVSALPADFAAPVCVVLHTAPHSPGILPAILSRAGALAASSATNAERLAPGRIYVAPPDCHLIVEPGRLRVTKGPKENRFRPAIDPLFRSAAQVYGPGTIGVILTGSLDDGSVGLWTVKQLGGTTIVQDPSDALFPSMPQHAIAHTKVDHIVPLSDVAGLLVELVARPLSERPIRRVPEHVIVEVKVAMEGSPIEAGLERIGHPSPFACPECHGVLLRIKDTPHPRFRCHTGHSYTALSLLAAVNEQIEASLWTSIRSLEEGRLLLCTLADHFTTAHQGGDAAALTARADETREHADMLRRLVTAREPFPVENK